MSPDPQQTDVTTQDLELGGAEMGDMPAEPLEQVLKVVMVDDEEPLCRGVQRIIDRYHVNVPDVQIDVRYEFDYCTSGEEFLQRLRGGAQCDLLLLDLKLPGISGLDVLTELNGQGRELLTIMVTAYATFETAVKATKIGAYDFLAKPFTPEELRYSVRKATSQLILSRQARRLAEEKRQVRFNFISILAHELKAPLNAIEGYLKILRQREETDNLQMIERSLVRLDGMKKLIVDLLDVTRIESGQKQRVFGEVRLGDLARSSLDLFRVEAADRGISLELSVADGLTMTADAGEIEIIVNNLVSNAVKYNRDGGTVRVAVARSGDEVTLTVEDTGIGMTPVESAKLFNEFTRIKNEDTVKILGSGLGLSTVRKLARLYGGDATVESERGVGSRFTVTLRDAVPPSATHGDGAADAAATGLAAGTPGEGDPAAGPRSEVIE